MLQEPIVFPYYEFSGTYREIGRQYGEACREQMRHMIDWWYENLAPIMPATPVAKMVESSAAFGEPIKEYAEDLYDELVGIAEGSGLSMNEVLFLQGSFELDVAGPFYLGRLHQLCCLR